MSERAWWGPAFISQTQLCGPFVRGVLFDSATEAGAIRQATDFYNRLPILGPVTVEIAKDEAEMRAANAAFTAEESSVLKICAIVD